MKDIQSYEAKKYEAAENEKSGYKQVRKGVYQTGTGKNKLFVTSLSFVQEPGYGEGKSSSYISQFPLEDLLDKYFCHVSDFYDELNDGSSETCYLEFASSDKEDIINLRKIIGKHVFLTRVTEGDAILEKLIIE